MRRLVAVLVALFTLAVVLLSVSEEGSGMDKHHKGDRALFGAAARAISGGGSARASSLSTPSTTPQAPTTASATASNGGTAVASATDGGQSSAQASGAGKSAVGYATGSGGVADASAAGTPADHATTSSAAGSAASAANSNGQWSISVDGRTTSG